MTETTAAGTITVLVADDEPGIRTGTSRSLRNMTVACENSDVVWSFRIEEAADGAEVVARLEQGGVDILLLDHGMPEITGLEVLDRLNGMDEAPLTVMITAYATLDMAVKATKQGAYDFLAKPFTPAELRETVLKAARHLMHVKAARRLAAEKHRVRFEFLSVLAHELKAPLGAVEGYLRLLQDGILVDDADSTARVIDRSLVRLGGMRKLIYDLLDLTRIESGQKTREIRDVDLEQLAIQVIETFEPLAAERGISLNLEVQGEIGFLGESGEMEIVFNNLVSNAIKYNRDGGKVVIEIDGRSTDLRLAFTDSGIGMTQDETERLFGEFVRIRNDKTTGIEGSGLGLSIVRRLVRLNGGDVTVASVCNEGTIFTVTLARTGVNQGCAS